MVVPRYLARDFKYGFGNLKRSYEEKKNYLFFGDERNVATHAFKSYYHIEDK